jgi:hypothetical protein
MKIRISLLATFLFAFLVLQSGIGQADDPLFRVVWVKGKPKRAGKNEIRDGEKLLKKDKVVFTSLQDVVILMNSHFEKIYLKPESRTELNKPLGVLDFLNRKGSSAEIQRRASLVTRGYADQVLIQTFSDTLRLNLPRQLRQPAGSNPEGYRLLDPYMEIIQGAVTVRGDEMVLVLPKTGLFYLHFTSGSYQNKAIAEIEFLERKEVLAELKFVAGSASPPDSSQSIQTKYLRKLYPNVPDEQVHNLIVRK